MERIPVKSSQISGIGWEPRPQIEGDPVPGTIGTLEIEFTSKAIYQYANVPYVEYRKFLAAESKGHHFAVHIRACYEYECVFKPEKKKEGVQSHGAANESLEKDLRKSIKQVADKKAAKERADRNRSSGSTD